jgi:hypothetical protein
MFLSKSVILSELSGRQIFEMKALLITALCLIGFIPAAAQHGGKAEPKRIQLAAGKTSASVSGTLRPSEEMEFVFGAKAGQTVTIKNPYRQFDFRVFSEENFPDGDFDSSLVYSFEIPADGDYNFFVRRKVGGPKRAMFRMTLTIK